MQLFSSWFKYYITGSTTSARLMKPSPTTSLLYKIDSHTKYLCVQLATCLVIRPVDEPLAEVHLKKDHDNATKFELLYIVNKGAPDNGTLFNYLQWTKECYSTLRRVFKLLEYDEITFITYILQKI